MPSITVSESDYVNVSIPTNTTPSFNFFPERDVLREVTRAGQFYETGHDDFFFQTDELNVSLKELMNRITKLELEVANLKQQLRGDIKL